MCKITIIVMDTLPDELLLLIFNCWLQSWAEDALSTEEQRPQRLLFEVCQRWRRLAFDRALWQGIGDPMRADEILPWVMHDAESVKTWNLSCYFFVGEKDRIPSVLPYLTTCNLGFQCTFGEFKAYVAQGSTKLTSVYVESLILSSNDIPVEWKLPETFHQIEMLDIAIIGSDRESEHNDRHSWTPYFMNHFIHELPKLAHVHLPMLHCLPEQSTLKTLCLDVLDPGCAQPQTSVVEELSVKELVSPMLCESVRLPKVKKLALHVRLQHLAKLGPLPCLEHLSLMVPDECEHEGTDFKGILKWWTLLPRHLPFLQLSFACADEVYLSEWFPAMMEHVTFDEMIVSFEDPTDFEAMDEPVNTSFEAFFRSLTTMTVKRLANDKGIYAYASHVTPCIVE